MIKLIEIEVIEKSPVVGSLMSTFAVVEVKSGSVLKICDTRFDAGDYMTTIQGGGFSKYKAHQTVLESYGFDNNDVHEMKKVLLSGDLKVNQELFDEYRLKIVAKVRAEGRNINSPEEVLQAVDGCVLGMRLKQIAVWGFMQYGSLANLVYNDQMPRVIDWLKGIHINPDSVRWCYVDANSPMTHEVEINQSLRLLINFDYEGRANLQVVCNIPDEVKVYDDLKFAKESADYALSECVAGALVKDGDHLINLLNAVRSATHAYESYVRLA